MDEVLVVAPSGPLRLEYARRVVHGATLQSGEWQDDGMVGPASSEGLVLRSPGALVAHEVGVGTAEAGGSYSLVSVDHDMVLTTSYTYGTTGYGKMRVVREETNRVASEYTYDRFGRVRCCKED